MPATITSRGTLVRGRWDFYENADAIAYCAVSAVPGPPIFWFTNNAVAQVDLDIFRIEVSQATASGILYQLFPNRYISVGFVPSVVQIIALNPNNPAPTGQIGVGNTFTAPAPVPFRQRTDSISYDVIELNGSDFFLTLPPLWTLQVSGLPGLALTSSVTIWYQQVADQVRPAG